MNDIERLTKKKKPFSCYCFALLFTSSFEWKKQNILFVVFHFRHAEYTLSFYFSFLYCISIGCNMQ